MSTIISPIIFLHFREEENIWLPKFEFAKYTLELAPQIIPINIK
jgi:hypothetical protein